MNNDRLARLALVFGCCLWALLAHETSADIRLPKVIGSHMVLQRDVPVRVWGQADNGQMVTVEFGGHREFATADSDGRWQVILPPMTASGRGQTMMIRAGDATVSLVDVLVGDVWVCSGQSNMEYPTSRPSHYKGPPAGQPDPAAEAMTAGLHPGIRLFKVQKVLSPEDVTTDGWAPAEGDALGKFSALGFFFAKSVHAETGVPIGLIDSSWGGTRIEVWTPADAYGRFSKLSGVPTTQPLYVEGARVGRNFERMIKPLVTYAIKGFLWYQGESNCIIAETERYTEKQLALIRSWRDQWQSPDAPFYFVQLAPYHYSKRKDMSQPRRDLLPEFWEAQADALQLPNTAMVVTTDMADNFSDIHPHNKWDIGRRLALVALARDYGKTGVVYQSPTFDSMTPDGGGLLVRFEHVGGGLKTLDQRAPAGFLVAGADGVFVEAMAEIVSADTVRVTSPSVARPTAVRFGWDEAPRLNLYGGTGLPVMPFRSDRPKAGSQPAGATGN